MNDERWKLEKATACRQDWVRGLNKEIRETYLNANFQTHLRKGNFPSHGHLAWGAKKSIKA